jgi:diaminopimelate decarboxylase
MDHFSYRNGVLHAEDVPVPIITESVGTPLYVYSNATLKRHYNVFEAALEGLDHLICYATKANSNKAILASLGKEGSGADVVSEGEIRQSIAAGIEPQKIVFSGVGKTKGELAYALSVGIFQFNVESLPELEALNEVASTQNKKAPVAIRVNPDIAPDTHAKISTGGKETKFGIPWEQAEEAFQKAHTLEHIDVQGISVHIGSQLVSLGPFATAFAKVRELAEHLQSKGMHIRTLDLGGGLGIPYETRQAAPPLPSEYGKMIKQVFAGFPATFIFEPGRLIVGNAGILVTKVIYIKTGAERRFVIVDAAMNDLLRPSLYAAFHDIVPVVEHHGDNMVADMVGPVCETGDKFAERRTLPDVKPDEIIAFRSCGAYGAVLSSTYNSRLLIPEVLVDKDKYAIIRPRPSYEEMVNRDHVPDWL